ncbi:MAG: O-antigen ligase family protein [Candidatus Hinthialibacter antarcticus]|nr:O-antigen ligase family protein [Candidatus Hinthialibacter antarcticus]
MVKRPKADLATRPTVFLHLTLCLLCFQLVSTALYYNGHFTDVLINKFLLGQVLALSAWLAYLGHCLAVGRFTLAKTPYDAPVLLFAAWAALRTFSAPDESALYHGYIFFALLSAFPLWTVCFRYKKFRSLFVWTVFFTGMCVMLGCLRQMSTDTPGFAFPGFEAMTLSKGSYERQFLCSFLGHNNPSTGYIAIACILAGAIGLRARSVGLRVFTAAYVLLGLALIILGGSRGVALMLITTTLFLVYAFQRAGLRWAFGDSHEEAKQAIRQWALRGLSLGALFIVVLFAVWMMPRSEFVNQNVFGRFTTSYQDLMTGTYPRVWWMSLQMVKDKPLTGVGFASWMQQYPEYQSEWFEAHPRTSIGLPPVGSITQRAHNDYFQAWAELGLPGLLLMIWLFTVHLRCIGQLLYDKRSLLGIFAATATLATMTRALFGFPFHEAPASCLFIANWALVAHLASPKFREWSPDWLTKLAAPQKWAMGAVGVVAFFITAMPVYQYMLADYLAKLHGRYGVAAANLTAEGDRDGANQWLEWGYLSLQRSIEIAPELGSNRYILAIDTYERGKLASDVEQVRRSIELFEETLKSYTYYGVYTYLGQAYLWAWEHSQSPEDAEKAIQAFTASSKIMPTDEDVLSWLALALGKTGRTEEGLYFVSELTLKFPGFVERSLLPAAFSAEARGDWLSAAFLFSMSAHNDPHNFEVARQTVEFYIRSQRLDLAEDVYVVAASVQWSDENRALFQKLLSDILLQRLSRGEYEPARDFLLELQQKERVAGDSAVWYYSMIVSSLGGHPFESIIGWRRAVDAGVDAAQLEPFRFVLVNQLLAPILQVY